MRLAIEKAREGILQGQTPFGACIGRAGEVVSCTHNVVWQTNDITAHAEVHAIFPKLSMARIFRMRNGRASTS